MKNTYVRATIAVLIATIVAGLVQANMRGPIAFLAFSFTFLGTFLVLVLACFSIFSLIRERAQSRLFPGQTVVTRSVAQSGTGEYYKKRLIWSLIVAAPGGLLWLSALFTTRNGGGEAYILAIPLFFVSLLALFVALLYGIAYLVKRGK